MTALIHIGDFHAAPGDRNPARYRVLDQIIREAEALPTLGGWLWPGDLNHGRMSIEDRNALAQRIQRMAARGPVVLCYGNHDLPGDLEVFGRLKAGFPIYVLDRPQCLRIRLATGENVTLFGLSYPTKGGLAAMGIAPPDVIDSAAVTLDAIFMKAADELDAARAAGDLTLMIGHVNVGGAITSTGQPNIGREIELSARHLDRLGDIPKLLNHIHVAQDIGGAWYAGSVCRLSWGEIEEKSYTVASFHTDVWALTRQPLTVAPMYHVEGDLTRDGFTWQVTAGPGGAKQEAPRKACVACGGTGDGAKHPVEGTLSCATCLGSGKGAVSWRGCEVRVRYKFRQSEKSVLAEAQVLAEFAEAMRLEVEPIAVPDRALRAPEVADARTLPDKLSAYATFAGTVATDAILDKLARLERSDGDQVVADVCTELNALLDQDETATVAA